MSRQINRAGLDLIKKFEGFRAEAYLDAVGVPTIGYGHIAGVTREDVEKGRRVTREEAERLLQEDLAVAEAAVERLIDVPLNDNQFAALVSFTFNLGVGSLQRSTLRRRLNQGEYDAVPAEMARWVRAGGRVLAGLVRRRAAEGVLFATPVEEVAETGPGMRGAVEPVPAGDEVLAGYLLDSVDLTLGSVDDEGDARYLRLDQNVPDGYVSALQRDLVALGFGGDMGVDGAFGQRTEAAVERFQRAVGLPRTGVVDQAVRDTIRAWLERGYTRTNPPAREDEALVELAGGRHLILPRIPHFSQGDPRWGGRILGRDASIARQGCAITCIAMVLRFYGRDADPGRLDAFLDAQGGYVGNSVKWNVAGRFAQVGKERLKYARKEAKVDRLRDLLVQRTEANRPTLVRVDYGVDPDLRYNHFVVCVGLTAAGDFVMNDPATRKRDGYANPVDDNLIDRTTRKGGYRIVGLDWYDPA